MPADLPTSDEVRAIVREELARALAELRRPTSDVLSTEQAAEVAGVSAKTVRAWRVRFPGASTVFLSSYEGVFEGTDRPGISSVPVPLPLPPRGPQEGR